MKKNAQFNSQSQWAQTNNIGRNKLTEQTYCNTAGLSIQRSLGLHGLITSNGLVLLRYIQGWMSSFKAWLSAIG